MWEDAEIISRYTWQQAVEDGQLVRVDEAADAAGWDLPVVITLGIAGDFEGEALVELVKRAWAKREADPNEDLHVLEGDREIWCVIDGWEVATILYPEER